MRMAVRGRQSWARVCVSGTTSLPLYSLSFPCLTVLLFDCLSSQAAAPPPAQHQEGDLNLADDVDDGLGIATGRRARLEDSSEGEEDGQLEQPPAKRT